MPSRRLVLPYGRAKAFHAAFLLAILSLVLTTLFLSGTFPFPRRRSIYDITEGKTSGPWRPEWDDPTKTRPSPNGNTAHLEDGLAAYLVEVARRHGLGTSIPVVARRVHFRHGAEGAKRPSLVQTRAALMGGPAKKSPPVEFMRIRVDREGLVLRSAGDPVSLPLGGARSPSPEEVDASALLFAVSTTHARVMYAEQAVLRDWARWLTDGRGTSNGAGLVVGLHGASEDECVTVRDALRGLGVDVQVVATGDGGDSGGRYAQLMRAVMRRRAGEPHGREYFALVDDDVFFPCVGRLLGRLRERFDSRETFYIGVPSERSDWVTENGQAVTYGGGAVFMTAGMLDMVGQLLCLQYTKTGGQTGDDGKAWDILLYECVARHAPSLKLHVLGTESRRILGYGGGTLPLALHRYRNYYRFEAGRGHLVTSACGEDCFLQRFMFKDGWVLVNGYTLTRYPGGVGAVRDAKSPPSQNRDENDVSVDDRLVTDEESGSQADGMTIAWKGRKKTWRLLDAMLRDNGEVWQAYVNRRGGGNAVSEYLDDRRPGDLVHHDEEEKADSDSVILLIWAPEK